MDCQIKKIKPDEGECKEKAIGLYKTKGVNLAFCEKHQLWAKSQRLILKKKDNYFG